MTWFIIALIAPLLWSLVNFADKYLLSKYLHSNAGSLIIFSSLFALVVLPYIYLFDQNIFSLAIIDICILVVGGILYGTSITLYLISLEQEDTSLVVPIYQTIPVFGFVLGFLLLGETLSYIQTIGGILVLLGAIFITFEFVPGGKHRIKVRVLIIMLFASLLVAIHDTLFKYVALDNSFWGSTFWAHVGMVVCGVLLFTFLSRERKSFLGLLSLRKPILLTINSLSEVATILGQILFSYATLLAPLALVLLVNSFQPVFVFIIGLILTLITPRLITEKISRGHLLHKASAIAIIIAGSYLLFI